MWGDILFAAGTANNDESSGAEGKDSGAGEGEVAMVDVPEALPEPLELFAPCLLSEADEPEVVFDS